MELKEQPGSSVFASPARRAGSDSPLLAKARELWRGRGRLEEWLMRLAYARGAWAYPLDSTPGQDEPDDAPQLTTEEIGICLCLPELSKDMLPIRMAAQLLTSPDIDADCLIALGRQEGCEPLLAHIARCCLKIEPDNAVWSRVAQGFANLPADKERAFPHWTRFVFHTGMDRTGRERIWWLHARKPNDQRAPHPANVR